jgi:hypothetical protein
MTDISIKQIQEVGEYWIVYKSAEGKTRHIQLSACANNFSIHRGGDGSCVGLRYEKDGYGYYELFTAGHTRIKFPLKPTGLQNLLGAKNAARKLRQQYESFEAALNKNGWRTIEESN